MHPRPNCLTRRCIRQPADHMAHAPRGQPWLAYNFPSALGGGAAEVNALGGGTAENLLCVVARAGSTGGAVGRSS